MSDNNISDSERIVDDFIAQKERFVPAREFEEEGKTLVFNSAKVRVNKEGKFGSVLEYTVKEVGSGIERIVTAQAKTLVKGLRQKLRERQTGTDVPLHVKRTGEGTKTVYVVEHAK